MRTLIAEDHDINQALILAMAKQAGLEADLAVDGHECVEMIERSMADGNPYELVLMDLQMPRMDGIEGTRRIRALGIGADELPIVALTANCYPDDIARCTQAGMQGHLAKPLKLDALNEAIVRHTSHDAAPAPAPAPAEAKPARGTGTLNLRYEKRKRETLARLEAALASGEPSDWDELISDLHKLAGTAGMFGDASLGEQARAFEHKLKTPRRTSARRY